MKLPRWIAAGLVTAIAASSVSAKGFRPRAPHAKAEVSQKVAKRWIKTLTKRMQRTVDQALDDGIAAGVYSAKPEQAHLSERHYNAVKSATFRLLATHSPANSFFLSLGRSPTAINEMLRILEPDMASALPGSDMRLIDNPQEHMVTYQETYNAEFDKYLPANVRNGSAVDNIVLIDRAREGKSLLIMKQLLDNYFQARGVPMTVRVVGMSPKRVTSGVEWFDTSDLPDLFLYTQGQFDADEIIGEHQGRRKAFASGDVTIGKHRVWQDGKHAMLPNPINAMFRQALTLRMKHDPELPQLITNLALD